MTDANADAGRSYMTAFLPGLVVGLVVGSIATAVLLPYLDSGPKPRGGDTPRIVDGTPEGHNHPGETVEDPNLAVSEGDVDPIGDGDAPDTPETPE